MALASCFRPCGFDDLPGWSCDDLTGALEAFRRSARHALNSRAYRTGALGVEAASFEPAFRASLDGATDARAFFETFFTPCLVSPPEGVLGLVTGFYEPEVEASPVRTPGFAVPLLARPADLVDVDDANRPAGLDASFAFARSDPSGLVEYHDRRAIDCGALEGQGLELAWLASKVDAFFIHVQGAARLRMLDGALRRVTYTAKTGHPFTGIGRVLAGQGEIALEHVTMQSIRAWLAANPARRDEILWRNRSYIFFRDAPVEDVALGPVAAAKVPLTPARSVAVDRLLHTFGTPFFIDAPELTAFGGMPFRRLMIAQDTGSAIVGAARGDLFAGSGDAAGQIAGVVRHAATFHALVPRVLAEAPQ